MPASLLDAETTTVNQAWTLDSETLKMQENGSASVDNSWVP